jgi:hypothetical protein
MSEPLPGDDFRYDLKTIARRLSGIEWAAATALYLVWYTLLSYWLSRITIKGRGRIIEVYVVCTLAITILNWTWGPTLWATALCSYFSTSTIVTLLQVLFLNKGLGHMESPERSLLLFILNVFQMLFMFASWYYLVTPLSKEDALFHAVLVLATLGYPSNTPTIVELQIAADFVLLAVFLAHLLGQVGLTRTK